jgi:hypothetical protein
MMMMMMIIITIMMMVIIIIIIIIIIRSRQLLHFILTFQIFWVSKRLGFPAVPVFNREVCSELIAFRLFHWNKKKTSKRLRKLLLLQVQTNWIHATFWQNNFDSLNSLAEGAKQVYVFCIHYQTRDDSLQSWNKINTNDVWCRVTEKCTYVVEDNSVLPGN